MNDEDINYLVTVMLFTQSHNCMPVKLAEAITWLQGFLDQVPGKYRDTATVEVECDVEYDWSYPTIEISYQRPPTDAEKKERLADEQRRAEMRKTEARRKIARLQAELDK